jgi:hypothetical protein
LSACIRRPRRSSYPTRSASGTSPRCGLALAGPSPANVVCDRHAAAALPRPGGHHVCIVLGHREPSISAEHRISHESLGRLHRAESIARRRPALAAVLTHDDELKTALYRIAQEAMTNGLKHSSADSLEVKIVEAHGSVTVHVGDDGQGFDPSATSEGFGLVGMRECVELLDGTLAVESAPGAGTTVIAQLPARRRPTVDVADMTECPRRSASSRRT